MKEYCMNGRLKNDEKLDIKNINLKEKVSLMNLV